MIGDEFADRRGNGTANDVSDPAAIPGFRQRLEAPAVGAGRALAFPCLGFTGSPVSGSIGTVKGCSNPTGPRRC